MSPEPNWSGSSFCHQERYWVPFATYQATIGTNFASNS